MKRIITYGTYDLFHNGHYRLLERAKKLGDHLIVGVTTDSYDETRGKLNVQQSLMERIENVKASGLADEIIIEEYEGQKINDIQKYNIDVFAIGSDWLGRFDYLHEYCKVVYLERTKGVSSTDLRNDKHGLLSFGVVGNGRIAHRFVKEARFVSGVSIEGVYGRKVANLQGFVDTHELAFYETDYDSFLEKVDAVYIATPHKTHYEYTKKALLKGKHVLCEKPATLSYSELSDLFQIANKKQLVFSEAIKTAYAPGFIRMIAVAKSGLIGQIVNVDASFTKLYENQNLREFSKKEAGGSFTELATYPLLAIAKLLGTNVIDTQAYSYCSKDSEVDLFTKMNLQYESAIATLKVGIGVKTEGDLIVSGTKGYLYVPAPWWLTEYFEVRFENQSNNKKYYYKFDGDGLRYELSEFVYMINNKKESHKLLPKESLFISKIIEDFRGNKNLVILGCK
ncbi:MAG: Gfo/Idh/MocA family oxidoreductase [Methyloprofundus sp.]|nr:Gfo/Idh/MocA family oxidoreductase [Methyloprofundus sp.]